MQTCFVLCNPGFKARMTFRNVQQRPYNYALCFESCPSRIKPAPRRCWHVLIDGTPARPDTQTLECAASNTATPFTYFQTCQCLPFKCIFYFTLQLFLACFSLLSVRMSTLWVLIVHLLLADIMNQCFFIAANCIFGAAVMSHNNHWSCLE